MTDKAHTKPSSFRSDPENWLGLALIGIGALILLSNLVSIPFGRYLWPLWIITPGLLLLWPAARMRPGQREPLAVLAVPGAVILSVGLLLLVMNLFNYFEMWAYAWPLPLIGALWGVDYKNRFQEDAAGRQSRRQAMRAMFWIFLIFAIAFELLVFHPILGAWWPLLLVVLGLYLVARNWRAKDR